VLSLTDRATHTRKW